MSRVRYRKPAVLAQVPRQGHVVLEASAGTGKTYALEHLVVELVLGGAAIDKRSTAAHAIARGAREDRFMASARAAHGVRAYPGTASERSDPRRSLRSSVPCRPAA